MRQEKEGIKSGENSKEHLEVTFVQGGKSGVYIFLCEDIE